ncbi:unnamed protein product [Rotaria socialis]|uniref:Uncharacterized protein n=1 Tax=Rotaria socialis TaxID=392032 RepID=A0A821AGC0_9BILA|nr:unnamed protein product [Rotaria socialis]CAF3650540.1 unnamed protein product [Rotaria socialis]CAF4499266.1 unnamed protein product [Rotaria socialis]CAF4557095.1 unnamed protein product [Rotaria socialis]CAF4571861.1 unnamed protein product [Rotaria socialis]
MGHICLSTTEGTSERTVDFDETLKSSKYSLETFVALPFLMNVSSLINIGYKTEWIKYVMKQYNTANVQLIDTTISEHKQEMSLQIDIEKRQNIFLRLGSSIDKTKLENLINTLTMNTIDQLATTYELMLTHGNDLQTLESITAERKIGNEFELDSSFFRMDEEQALGTIGIFDQRKKYVDSLIPCEYRLTSMYARDPIMNMWTNWSNTRSPGFPLETFRDYPSIVKLF